jgi:cytoskeletal protein RodZ
MKLAFARVVVGNAALLVSGLLAVLLWHRLCSTDARANDKQTIQQSIKETSNYYIFG